MIRTMTFSPKAAMYISTAAIKTATLFDVNRSDDYPSGQTYALIRSLYVGEGDYGAEVEGIALLCDVVQEYRTHGYTSRLDLLIMSFRLMTVTEDIEEIIDHFSQYHENPGTVLFGAKKPPTISPELEEEVHASFIVTDIAWKGHPDELILSHKMLRQM